jgi:hypothetical protein
LDSSPTILLASLSGCWAEVVRKGTTTRAETIANADPAIARMANFVDLFSAIEHNYHRVSDISSWCN